ncbi:hypothetical protein GALMADRAFT_238230 [Galerina marginata CBS 339.88]|uniref:Uncharacterized protein n=1 Tax=Galerina marginata (strain CBS 339.88) TaxID=685588 RepID=A0A067THL4_GALM3|nr:hypothetical protein GALMADRAFT_238230 [Galerina marginata CBS 339.88]
MTMYSLSTIHISFSLRQSLVAFFDQSATNGGLTTFNDPGSFLLIAQTSLELVNCLIGDSIVLWRAWVLWGGGRAVLVLPSILIMTGAITGSFLVHAYATSGISRTLYNNNVTLWVEVFGAVTFSANFYAICIIGYKAWQHERAMKQIFTHGRMLHRVVLVIIESGMIYCIVLLVTVGLISAGNDFGVIVIIDILAHLTGIYPSLILILISANVSMSDQVMKDNSTLPMVFQAPSRNPRHLSSHAEQYPMESLTVQYTSTGGEEIHNAKLVPSGNSSNPDFA